jgi:hypothetical protein
MEEKDIDVSLTKRGIDFEGRNRRKKKRKKEELLAYGTSIRIVPPSDSMPEYFDTERVDCDL